MASRIASGWSLPYAFLAGAVLGAVVGFIWGAIDYGAFDIAFFYNHVLGGIYIVGFLFTAAAAIANWCRRNPL